MSIRMVAVELYRVMKKIEELEKKLGSLKPDSPEIEEVDKEMRETVAERDRLKKMIDGAKGS